MTAALSKTVHSESVLNVRLFSATAVFVPGENRPLWMRVPPGEPTISMLNKKDLSEGSSTVTVGI